MSNSCQSVPVPCENEVPGLLIHLSEINCEAMSVAKCIEEKLFGEEKRGNAPCDPIDQNGYIGSLKRLARDNFEVLEILRRIAGVL